MKRIINQRNRDFLRKCRERITLLKADGRVSTIEDVVDYVLLHPAPRYYADNSRIYRRVISYMNGERAKHGTVCATEGFEDLMRDLAKACKRFPEDSVRINLMRLTAGLFGSPRFYISRHRALMLAHLNFSEIIA
ncbi:MAG: hypothetical protein K2M19_08880 [Muribaculaceae bacterium]|nr:hypothetical protein [Muribaculaceae bacterium]